MPRFMGVREPQPIVAAADTPYGPRRVGRGGTTGVASPRGKPSSGISFSSQPCNPSFRPPFETPPPGDLDTVQRRPYLPVTQPTVWLNENASPAKKRDPPMAVKKTDRDNVIAGALNLFRVQGYHNTSMSDISGACGLLKGSVYHYFPGKRELAVAALDRVIEDGRARLFIPANDDGKSPKERLEALAEAVEGYFIGREGGCLMGNLALEIGPQEPAFRERIRTYFNEWAEALTGLLEDRYGTMRARELAEDAIARVQGAIMMMGLNDDPSILRRTGRDIVALLD